MTKTPTATTQAERRNARLAEALRANLARRKARARSTVPAAIVPVGPDDAAGDTE